jgi:hypothetical protein
MLLLVLVLMIICIILILIALLLIVSAWLISKFQRHLPVTNGTRCLLLIAHPDDECKLLLIIIQYNYCTEQYI